MSAVNLDETRTLSLQNAAAEMGATQEEIQTLTTRMGQEDGEEFLLGFAGGPMTPFGENCATCSTFGHCMVLDQLGTPAMNDGIMLHRTLFERWAANRRNGGNGKNGHEAVN